MDKADSKNQPIRITFIEINPPINELIKPKDELNIIFQGHDNFYDFKKCFSTKIPIQLNRYKKSLIMTLLKSNSIFATGLFTVRHGEQNIIFNYEDNKKVKAKKAVNINNLLDCIKIKILCEFDNKDKDIVSSVNNNLKENNDSSKKYVPKVNLMKSNNHLKIKNNHNAQKIYEKKKKILGNFCGSTTNKRSTINISQEFPIGGDYNAILTEEVINNNIKPNNNNFNPNEIKKLSPYCSSKMTNKLNRKNENEISKSNVQINKAKSKNFFSTIKKQNRLNFGNQIKMNNSSLNLINQKNNMNSIDNNENLSNNNNSTTNRILKPTISFNKTTKRNVHNIINNINNNKNLINSIDSFISKQIIEHVDKSKKDKKKNIVNTAKKDLLWNNKNINNNNDNHVALNNNEKKKRKLNNNNITMNSISTAGTKKNDLEFSANSLIDYKDYDDKLSNKNDSMPFTNRHTNERMTQKLSNANSINRNINKHKFNKSLCQHSFIDKIFNENDINIKDNENKSNYNSNLSKSFDKLKNDNNNNNLADYNINNNNNNESFDKSTNKENKDIKNSNSNNKNDNNEIEYEEDLEMDNYNRLKEDFNLLYNDEYIKQINEDLLKLEIELFFEKISELFSAYHLIMDEKILENQIIKRDYKRNIEKFLLYIKLNNKLGFMKAQQKAQKQNLKDNGINFGKQNLDNIINMNELSIFKFIFLNENKSKKLKKIISIIMKKKENKELLDEKFKMLLK